MGDIRTATLTEQRVWLGLGLVPVSQPPRVGRSVGARMYAAARGSRLTAGWTGGNTSADAELTSSLTFLRQRSRALVRDASYAKRARTIIQLNVIGTGIGMQAQVMTTRGELATRVNDAIEREFDEWKRAPNCHTGGALHFADFERACMGQVFEAGEVFIRKHYTAFGDSEVPFALELIEPERLAEDFRGPSAIPPSVDVRMGVEVDIFGRAQAYWIRERHPGDLTVPRIVSDRFLRVPASEIIHLRIIDRWPQSRGEPWLHAVARKLNDMDGYTEAEIVAARGAASYMGFIKTDDPSAAIGEVQADGTEQYELAPGSIPKLGPGEEFQGYSPNRPNSALDPFLRYMLREVASGLSISYESLSRDYSQSNYSSSRLSLLDDRDVWRSLQQWFLRAFREPLHREWLQAAVLSGAIPEIPVQAYGADPERFGAVLFKPRGWNWVDPTKEVTAYKEAIRAGFTTTSRVIAATADGADLEDIIIERKRELELLKAAGIILDTDVSGPVAPKPPGARPTAPDPAADPAAEGDVPVSGDIPPARIISAIGELEIANSAARMIRQESAADFVAEMRHGNWELVRAIRDMKPTVVTVEAPTITVNPPSVVVEAPNITVNPPAVNVAPPNITVNPPNITVAPAQVNVKQPNVRVEPAQVNVQVMPRRPGRKQIDIVERDSDGFAKKIIETESEE